MQLPWPVGATEEPRANTLSINAEGTGDYPTIEAAIDSAQNGHTVVVAPGLDVNFGNQDITMTNKVLTLRSQGQNDPNAGGDTVGTGEEGSPRHEGGEARVLHSLTSP